MAEGGITMVESEQLYKTEVASLEKPMTVIVDQLKPNLESAAYSLIIGDDTSGRLPALVLHQVADVVYERHGLPKMPTVFIQAGRNIEDEEVRRQVEGLKAKYASKTEGKKALLVTDYVRSGGTMQRLTELFSQNGINFDVATLDMDEPEETYRQRGVFSPNTTVFSGNPDANTNHDRPEIWSKPTLTGLKRAKKPGEQVSILNLGPEIRQDTLNAREDIKILSQKLISHIYPR